MMDKKKMIPIAIGFTLLFIGFFVYNNFIKKDEGSAVEIESVSSYDPDVQKITGILDRIAKIELDDSIFKRKKDPRKYLLTLDDLRDYEQKIQDIEPGKVNPFLPGMWIGNYLSDDNIGDSTDQNQENNNKTNTDSQVKVEEKLVDDNQNNQ